MGLFGNKPQAGGFMDQIRCDEQNYLIWKWHPNGSEENNNNRENAIRYGSSLRVKDGEVAVFVYKQNDGTVEEFIEGPFDKKIETKNFPILASIIGLAYEGGTPFQAEIYFINLAQIIQTRFAVPFFEVYDPRFKDYGVPTAVRGTISFKIDDYKNFIKLHRLTTFNLNDFQGQVKDVVSRYVKDVVANAPAQNDIPLVQIETKIAEIDDVIEFNLKQRLKEDFGVEATGVDIEAIELDKTSSAYEQLMAVTKNITAATIKAQTEVNIKQMFDKQRIEAENYQETLRIQREEGQYAQHKATQTANLSAYQTEAQTEVGKAGAEALGKMGANGAGGVNLGDGGSGTGFNPAAMMAGMALGGAVGQNIAGVMNGAMNGVNLGNGQTPPPVPTNGYYVAVDGKATGPFDIATLTTMGVLNTFNKDSLVWKQGMQNWVAANTIDELKQIFNSIPPIPENK